MIEGSWIEKAQLELPEACGFFPRQDVCLYLANPDDSLLNIEEMLSVEEYRKLEPEAKKAYQYFEYTDPVGTRQILRNFKTAVLQRVWAYNDHLAWHSQQKEITLSDVRVLVTQS